MLSNRLLAFQYGITIFLGAFLLFQVQPIVGKMILPWFGGSASVWTVCMLFFQVLLLLGYLYCHGIVSYLSPRTQSFVHIFLLVASMSLLPLGLSEAWRPTGSENPTIRILLLLIFSIGLPYFTLSATGPLIQAWFSRESPASLPYRLFALSNLGSLLALLGYPIAVEPMVSTRWQAWLWSLLFTCFAVSCGLLAWRGKGRSGQPTPRCDHASPPLNIRLAWISLAACPSILLLAITSHLTEDIAPVPLLWIIPLALYLLSFIICFERQNRYKRQVFRPLLALGLFAVAGLPFLQNHVSILVGTATHLVVFFVACMVCHGELALKQPDPKYLTSYYLMLAIGGAMGGLFVGVLAPYWFSSNYELSISLVLTAGIVWTVGQHEEPNASPSHRFWGRAAITCLIVALAAIRFIYHWADQQSAELTARNFYGRLKVSADGQGENSYRSLSHGRILHGRQFVAPARQGQPTSYYGPESGAGRALLAKSDKKSLRIGIVGLGVGTLLAYGRNGDYFRLYDINPLVIDIARSHFTYLSRTAAHTNFVLGDARLTLGRESPQEFDVLIVDAFSGDAVPVHLLTREAIELYVRHLKPDGILAVHVTNTYLDLAPIIKSATDSFQLQAGLIHTNVDQDNQINSSDWVLVSSDSEFFRKAGVKENLKEIKVRPDFQAWRDDYSSLLKVLK